jgi:4-aminobutyrate aminotransferase-like enzyme
MTTSTRTMNPETADLFAKYVVPNYTRFPVSLVRGEGSLVWDDQGRQYLDFFPGWGCNLLGHCPPRVVEAIQQQAAELIHVPNTWHTEAQGRWAQLLSQRSFGGNQAGPAAHAGKSEQDHHVSRRVSWADVWRDERDGPAQVSRRDWTAVARF